MRRLRHTFVLALLALTALVGVGVGPASAAPVTATGGATALTTSSAVTTALLKRGIYAYADGGTTSFTTTPGPTATFSLPVSGGTFDIDTFSGTIAHSGSLVLVNRKTRTSVRLSAVTFDLETLLLSAKVGRASAATPIFSFVAGNLDVAQTDTQIAFTGYVVRTTLEGAAALDRGLRTSFFTPEQTLGTATSTVTVPAPSSPAV